MTQTGHELQKRRMRVRPSSGASSLISDTECSSSMSSAVEDTRSKVASLGSALQATSTVYVVNYITITM